MHAHDRKDIGIIDRLVQAFDGWRIPTFFISVLLLFMLLSLGLLLIPASRGGMGEFAESFRLWCFGYDPETGKMEPMYVVMLILNPLMLSALTVGVWWQPLRTIVRHDPRRLLGPFFTAFALVSLAAGGLFVMGAPETNELSFEFPAEAIRTSYEPPQIRLTNQEGELIDLNEQSGRVVLLTAVYATCGYTCPMIMGQTRRVVERLSPEALEDLTIIGITLDPENDDVEMLAAMAKGQEVSAPLFNLVTGDPVEVNAILDKLGVERKRDPETGIIDHSNLFLLVDRQGRIAYRLSLGTTQEEWLLDALQVLLAEPGLISR